MAIYSYNYPWSGRLGRVASRCIYCGDDGTSFSVSSSGHSCTQCIGRKAPLVELELQLRETIDKTVRAWCKTRHIDYDATVAAVEAKFGPKWQDRDSPIPGATEKAIAALVVYIGDKT
jgi:hypothetical protein